MDVCVTNIKSQNRWPWYCFKLCPLFLPSPSIRENKLSGSQERKGVSFCSGGCHVAWAHSVPPVWCAKNPGLLVSVWPRWGRSESQAAREYVSAGSAYRSLARSSTFWEAHMCVQWKSTLGMKSPPLPPRPTACSMVVAAANSFSEEAQRKLRKDCPHHSACLSNNKHQVQWK